MIKSIEEGGIEKSYTINDMPAEERPRERLLRLGISALTAEEILALILGRGVSGESVMVTAKNLLKEFRGVEGLARASIAELSRVHGIGVAKAAQIQAAFELSKRLNSKDDPYIGVSVKSPGRVIKSPDDMIKYIGDDLKGKLKEYFQIVLLNTRNQVIGKAAISVGSLNTSIVHPREVFKEAISASSAAIILVHNHPSGDPQPSEDDIKLTKRLVEAGEIVGIEILDHLIVCDTKYLSMKSKGLF